MSFMETQQVSVPPSPGNKKLLEWFDPSLRERKEKAQEPARFILACDTHVTETEGTARDTSQVFMKNIVCVLKTNQSPTGLE